VDLTATWGVEFDPVDKAALDLDFLDLRDLRLFLEPVDLGVRNCPLSVLKSGKLFAGVLGIVGGRDIGVISLDDAE